MTGFLRSRERRKEEKSEFQRRRRSMCCESRENISASLNERAVKVEFVRT